MKTGYRLLTNFSVLAVADIYVKATSLLTVFLYSRALGPVGLGELSVASTLISYILLVCSWGYFYYGLDEIGRSANRTNDVVSSLQSFRFYISLLSFIVFLLVLGFLPYQMNFRVLCGLYALTILTGALSPDWVFQALEQMHIVALGRVIAATISSAIVIVAVMGWKGAPHLLWIIPAAMVVSQLAMNFYLVRAYFKKGFRFHWRFEPRTWMALYKEYWPNGLSTMLVNLFLTFDIVMLGWWVTKEQTGLYSAGYRFLSHIISFALIFNSAVYPILARYAQTNEQRFSQVITYVVRILLTFYTPFCLVGVTLSGPLLRLMFGARFLPGSFALSMLLLASLFTVINLFFSQVYLANKRRKLMLQILSAQLVVNLLINAYAIPHWGKEGAAICKLVCEAMGFFLYVYFLHDLSHIDAKSIAKPLPALLILVALLGVLRLSYASAWIIFPAGLLAYSGALFLTRGVSADDIRYAASILRKTA